MINFTFLAIYRNQFIFFLRAKYGTCACRSFSRLGLYEFENNFALKSHLVNLLNNPKRVTVGVRLFSNKNDHKDSKQFQTDKLYTRNKYLENKKVICHSHLNNFDVNLNDLNEEDRFGTMDHTFKEPFEKKKQFPRKIKTWDKPEKTSSTSIESDPAAVFGTMDHTFKEPFEKKKKIPRKIKTQDKPEKTSSTSIESDPADVFGTLSDNEKIPSYKKPFFDADKYEDDEEDVKERELLQSRRRMRNTPVWYGNECRKLAKAGKLKEALEMLEIQMLKVDRVKPIPYNFTVLIGACGRAGYTKKAFSLYNKMKKRGLSPEKPTYTGLFNACANSPWKEDGLSRAHKLYSQMLENDVIPNVSTSNAMMKAFGRWGELETVFQIMDKMVENGWTPNVESFNFLLQGCISDREMGFKLAIEVWRQIRKKKLQPDIYSYNLLLKAVKCCGIGDASFANELIQKKNSSESKVTDAKYQTSITYSTSMPQSEVESCYHTNSINMSSDSMPLHHDKSNTLNFLELEKLPNILSPRGNYQNIISLGEITTPSDRLALIGGLTGILSHMTKDNVKPDIKTFTQLVEIVSSSRQCEEQLMDTLRDYKVEPDVDFFNLLIKKRNFRKDFSGSMDVLAMIRDFRLYPNVLTFGCLALGCTSRSRALQLIKDMELVGFTPNIEILGTLARQATLEPDFWFLIDICKEIKRLQLKPNETFLHHVENCIQKTRRNIMQKPKTGIKGDDFYDLKEFEDKTLDNNSNVYKEFLKEDKTTVESKYGDEKFIKSFSVFQKYYKGWLLSINISAPQHPWSDFRYPIKSKEDDKSNDNQKRKQTYAVLKS